MKKFSVRLRLDRSDVWKNPTVHFHNMFLSQHIFISADSVFDLYVSAGQKIVGFDKSLANNGENQT